MLGASTRPFSHGCVAVRICVGLLAGARETRLAANGCASRPFWSVYTSQVTFDPSVKVVGSMTSPTPVGHVSGTDALSTNGPSGALDVATPTHSRPAVAATFDFAV